MNNLKIKIDFIYKGKMLYALSAILFLITFYILFFLKPNEVNLAEQRFSYLFTSLVHAGLPMLIFLTLPLFIPKRYKDQLGNWQVAHEASYIILLLVIIGLGNFLVRDLIYINENNWSLGYLMEEVTNGFTIGLIIALIVVLLRIAFEQNRNLKKANQLMANLSEQQPASKGTKTILIEGQVKSEKFEIKVEEFLFAKASGNYIDIYLNQEQSIKKLTKRISLTAFMNFFQSTKNIIRTHKSYVVNILKIQSIKGNKAGLFLDLHNFKENSVPVSRKYIHHFEEVLATNKY